MTLMMLTVIMLLGTSVAQITLMNEKSSRNLRDRQIAFEAAEAALADATYDIFYLRKITGLIATPALATGTDIGTDTIAAGTCSARDGLHGVCVSDIDKPLWQKIDLRASTTTVAYGQFSGRIFSGTRASGTTPAQVVPRYLIEVIRFKNSNPATKALIRYRITAIGFGSNSNTQLVIQAVFDSASKARLSWREIANWQELYQGTSANTSTTMNNSDALPADFEDFQWQ